jgi:hypothetical protein
MHGEADNSKEQQIIMTIQIKYLTYQRVEPHHEFFNATDILYLAEYKENPFTYFSS